MKIQCALPPSLLASYGSSITLFCASFFVQANCDNEFYPGTEIKRFAVPTDKINWTTHFPTYAPVEYTSPIVLNASWADPDISSANFKPQFNQIDGNLNRKSYHGPYEVENGRPKNMRRTGIIGRGSLGRWGPNHAGDPVVTRWKRDEYQSILKNNQSGKLILQFISIQRRTSGNWAIPGGMVDPGEDILTTLKREFGEEALNTNNKSTVVKNQLDQKLSGLFANGKEIFKGYVDDPRNTDNAWMETFAINFHDGTGQTLGTINLEAGDDASDVKWSDIDSNITLYASHKSIVEKVACSLNAHW